MKNDYPHIFSPLTVKNMTIKNRIVMMPMGTNYGEQNGEMSFLHINYYEQRAKGGTGLIIVENASIDSPQGSNGTTQLRIDHDNYLPRLFKFCENIHRYGTKIAIQVFQSILQCISAFHQLIRTETEHDREERSYLFPADLTVPSSTRSMQIISRTDGVPTWQRP